MDDFIVFEDIETEADKKRKRAQSLVGTSADPNRPPEDFYRTPEIAVEKLLSVETFIGDILEPSCGDGAISEVLIAHGHNVVSCDLIDRGYGIVGEDFLLSERRATNIITNPPFKLAEDFATKALEKTTGKVVFLCKLQWLEGAKRRVFFENSPLARVHVFSKRITMYRNGEKGEYGSSMLAFAWFTFEHGYQGKPTINWI